MHTRETALRALGIEEGGDIGKAFRKLAARYHPDVSTEPDCENRFKEVNEAYQYLCKHDQPLFITDPNLDKTFVPHTKIAKGFSRVGQRRSAASYVCDKCKGTGFRVYLDGGRFPCTSCKGTGKLT